MQKGFRLEINNNNIWFGEDVHSIVAYLKKRGLLFEFDYDLKDKYEMIEPMDGILPNFEKGTVLTLGEWIEQYKKFRHPEDQKPEEELVYFILTRSYFWKKVKE